MSEGLDAAIRALAEKRADREELDERLRVLHEEERPIWNHAWEVWYHQGKGGMMEFSRRVQEVVMEIRRERREDRQTDSARKPEALGSHGS